MYDVMGGTVDEEVLRLFGLFAAGDIATIEELPWQR